MWDIILIGAGPASASFGSSIASSGLKVMIIDGQTEDRPKPCGGLLAPDAQKILADLISLFQKVFWPIRRYFL